MCELCLVNPLYFGEVIPGWNLVRARRKGNEMEPGDWGLQYCNSPSFIWKTTPKVGDDYPADDFEFYCDPKLGYEIIVAAEKAGYDKQMPFTWWLWERIAQHIVNTEPEIDSDPFPQREEMFPTDTTIWKD